MDPVVSEFQARVADRPRICPRQCQRRLVGGAQGIGPPKISWVRGANREIGVPGEERGGPGPPPPLALNCTACSETICGAAGGGRCQGRVVGGGQGIGRRRLAWLEELNREIGVPGERRGGRWSAPSPIAARVAKRSATPRRHGVCRGGSTKWNSWNFVSARAHSFTVSGRKVRSGPGRRLR